MNILLIDPPYNYAEIGGAKQSFRNVLNRIPALGLAYLAAVAQQKGHQVKIIDCTFKDEYDHLNANAKLFGPDIIGITATTPSFRNAALVAVALRKVFPQAVFICGGAHPTVCAQDCLNEDLFDFLVLGEGEETFLELINYIQDKQQYVLENIRGIAFKRGAEIMITAAREKIKDLDALPFPARHLLRHLSDYHPTPASYRKLPVAVMMTSRGCPSRCVFCDRSVFGDKFRSRSVENVMAEVEEVTRKHKAREVRFFDDTFTQDADFVEEICAAMRKLRPRVPWTCLTKVSAVNFEMLKLMRGSGCWQVLFGLESGDDYILSKLGKDNTVAQNKRVVLWAKQAGLSVRADFLVGSPWETKASFKKTLDFANSLPLDFAHFNKFVPLPGSDIYKNLVAQGHEFSFDQGFYINNHNDFAYLAEGFSRLEYGRVLNAAYKNFYLRPAYIWRRLLSLRTFDEICGQVRGLSSILSL
jgi:anaerobic magnesium-protoporphyrin IX monomethyl ester cyclase